MDISQTNESGVDGEDAAASPGSDEEGSQAQNEDIPLSDIESLNDEERGDITPHQRVTINNPSALLQALKSIALPASKLPFSEHQIVISPDLSDIPDVNDDLNRELAFYKQSLDAVKIAQNLLKREGVPFTRPTDYFAEMVKSDEHMDVIKKKMMDEAASKKAAVEARKQRDLRKFGKQVQVAKLQERDRAKRDTMEKIQILKRSMNSHLSNLPHTRKLTDLITERRGTGATETNEEDLFDVALEDASKEDRRDRAPKNVPIGKASSKRQKRDQKFGFGGKKRFSKSGDAVSSGDMKGFSMKKMKGQKKASQRLGKSRRAKQG
jgi:rRNA-processing protein EBP2